MNKPHMYKDHLTGHKWFESQLKDYEVYETSTVFIMLEVCDLEHNFVINEYKAIYNSMIN
jgi:hypothetical protein